MSEVMTQAIIGMPFDMAMDSELSRRQFHDRAQQLLADYAALVTGCARLHGQLLDDQRHITAIITERDAALAELATVKKVAYGNLELLDETELLKAELAALKGGQVQLDTLANLLPELDDALEDLEMHGRHSDQGYRKLKDWYRKMEAVTDRIAPPAQASEWVPVSESLPADRRDVMLYCADTKEHFVGFSKGGGLFQFAQDGNGLSIVCRPSHWRYIEDSDAPTPGASDGKGGDA